MVDYQIQVNKDKGYLICVIEGLASRQDMTEVLGALQAETRAANLGSWLLDVRKAKNLSDPFDAYRFANHDMPKLDISHRFKIAVLTDPMDTSNEFSQLAAVNAGYQVELFKDEELAFQWLGIAKDPQ